MCDELLLPNDFAATAYTQLRTKGDFTLVTFAMFEKFRTSSLLSFLHFSQPRYFRAFSAGFFA